MTRHIQWSSRLDFIKDARSTVLYRPFVTRLELERATGGTYSSFVAWNHPLDYYKMIKKYPSAHEVIPKWSWNNLLTPTGRLVFDLDYKDKSEIPDDFMERFEKEIISVFKRHYRGVNTDRFEFVWRNTEHKKKFSKHLVIKNAFFSEKFHYQLETFYQRAMEDFPDDLKMLIDLSLSKGPFMLRLPAARKPGEGKKPSTWDRKRFNVFDALVDVYLGEDRIKEQHILCNQHIGLTIKEEKKKRISKAVDSAVIMKEKDYIGAIKKIRDWLDPDDGKAGFDDLYSIRDWREGDEMIYIDRKCPSKCLIDTEKLHERENMVYFINSGMLTCFRGCKTPTGKKCIRLL